MSPSLLVSREELDSGSVSLSGRRHHHLSRVLRVERGAEVLLTDGRGAMHRGLVVEMRREETVVEVGEPTAGLEPEVDISLAVAMPRPERASWLVEKATEVGAVRILFFRCERGPRRAGPRLLERLERVARSALQQSRRSRLPRIEIDLGLEETLEWARGQAALFVLDPVGELPLIRAVGGDAAVVVGPEGGLTAFELDNFRAAGARTVRLGAPILRVETAAVVACAAFASTDDPGRRL